MVTSGKALRQVETHLVAEDGKRAGPGPVVLADALVEDSADKVVIGLHGGSRAERSSHFEH